MPRASSSFIYSYGLGLPSAKRFTKIHITLTIELKANTKLNRKSLKIFFQYFKGIGAMLEEEYR